MTSEQSEAVSDPRGDASGTPNLLRIAWDRRSLVGLGILVGLVLAALYYVLLPPSYQTTAQLLVIKNQPDSLQTPGLESHILITDDYLATHITLIKSAVIVTDALKKPEVRDLASIKQRPEPLEALLRSLTVTRDSKNALGGYNNVLNLKHMSAAEGDGTIILAAIIDSYNAFLQAAYRRSNDDTLDLVTKARNALEKELGRKQEKYKAFRSEAPLLREKRKDDSTLNQDRLSSIETRRSALLLRVAAIQGHLEAVEDNLKEGGSTAALVSMVSDFATRTRDNSTAATAVPPAEMQAATLAFMERDLLNRLGPDHPQVQSVRKRIEMASNPVAVWAQVRGLSDIQDKERIRAYVTAHVDQLKSELDHLKREERHLSMLAKRFQSEAKDLSNYEIEDEVLRDDIERTRKFYDTIIKRLQEVNLVKEFRGYDAHVISAPRTKPVLPNPLIILFLGAFLGTLAGCGLALVAYVSDRSFHTPEDIRRRLGLPLMGYVPHLKEAGAARPAQANGQPGLAPALCSYHQPRSRDAEAFRGLRTALFFAARGAGQKVIQITSPSQGDGKSTLAANLAISIAQMGKSVLLIDADFRRPRTARLFGLKSVVGLAGVLVEQTELEEAIQDTPVPGLAILPCGPIPTDPAERLNSPRFKEAVASLRDEYDFVVIDTPPLLAVSDPCVVTAVVDAVLLVVRICKNGRPAAERAKAILDTLGVPILGAVVNGVGAEHGYGYGYGYQESYQQDADEENGTANGDTGFSAPDVELPAQNEQRRRVR